MDAPHYLLVARAHLVFSHCCKSRPGTVSVNYRENLPKPCPQAIARKLTVQILNPGKDAMQM